MINLAGAPRGPRRAIAQPAGAPRADRFDQFGDRLGCRVELPRRRNLAQAAFGHAAHHRLSTFWCQRRILMDVHLVSPGNTEASQPQLLRFRPDGQPPESSELDTVE